MQISHIERYSADSLSRLGKTWRNPRNGFTLVEMLVVIGIIALLAALLFPILRHAKQKALVVHCETNIRNLSYSIFMHREEYDGVNPEWLSTLFPDYVNSKEAFVCLSDKSHGRGGSMPEEITNFYPSVSMFEETDDTNFNKNDEGYRGRNTAIELGSYLYEFCNAECSWTTSWPNSYLGGGGVSEATVDKDDDGVTSWGEVKMFQLWSGDMSVASRSHPYLEEKFPIVRCFHHYFHKDYSVANLADDGTLDFPPTKTEGLTLNVAYAGNVFRGPMTWELRK
ncbi:MAG: type II secretion system protein [Verrucomicrobia bacterium]|nr:type II secretion system protein [Verrucomicrobiota bacterium]MDA1086492.1 type II secretion system protein [Verrucomicrobiota bacterium]